MTEKALEDAVEPDLRLILAEVTGLDTAGLTDDDDLINVGVDSLGIMRVANHLRAAGYAVPVSGLMEHPSLGRWRELLDEPTGPGELDPGPDDPLTADDGAAPFPLSAMQHAYWVGRMPGHPLSVASHFYCEFDTESTPVDVARLEGAVRATTRRHASLRTRFGDDGTQQVLEESPWPGVTVHDLRAGTRDEADRALAATRRWESNRRLEVEQGRVFDVRLSLLPGGATRLHVDVDMLAADASSFRLVLDEMARRYHDPSLELAPLGYDYRRYLVAADVDRAPARERARQWWARALPDLPPAPQLPLAVAPESVADPHVTRRERWLSTEEHQRIRQLAASNDVTLSMALATAFADVIRSASAERRFLLNLPVFDRRPVHPEVDELVGDFTNLLLLPIDDPGQVTFVERVRRLQSGFRRHLAMADHQGMDVLRDLSHRAGSVVTAPVVFTSALGLGDLFGARVRAAFGSLSWMVSQTSQVWLDHQVTEEDGRVLLNWDAVEELFPPGLLDVLFDRYVDLVTALANDATAWHRGPDTGPPPTQRDVRARVNDTARPIRSAGLHEAFFQRAVDEPGAVALCWGETSTMSYGELAARAQRLARRLRDLGVGPGDAVALTLPKGPRQVEAVLGTLLSGATYVPVGVDTPPARRQKVLAGAGCRVVITDPDHPLEVPGEVEMLPLDRDTEGLEPYRGDRWTTVDPAELAYLIFTSGSTGQPKGVMVPHRAAVNLVDDLSRRCRVGPEDRVLAVSALDFDLSVYDLFGVLSAGGAVVCIEEAARRDAEWWVAAIERFGVTLWQSVPTLLDMVIAASGPGRLESLRYALVGGDWPAVDLGSRLRSVAPGCQLVALGGTTETTIHSTWFSVDAVPAGWPSVPWGVPLANTRCRVVGPDGDDRLDWVPGELWIGGASVAAGYRGDAELTASRFVEHDGGRWYRTGDIARYRPDGNLEFLGRLDHQVKVRGHRIELGDVETGFEQHPRVDRAVAVGLGQPGRCRLGVVCGAAGWSDPGAADELRSFVAGVLPGHLAPDDLLVVEELPLGANGKIDRRAAAELLIDGRPTTARGGPPDGPTEQALAKLWGELLDREIDDRTANFFALGGDSLLATRFVQRCQQRHGLPISLRQLFEHPTIAQLAEISTRDDLEQGVL